MVKAELIAEYAETDANSVLRSGVRSRNLPEVELRTNADALMDRYAAGDDSVFAELWRQLSPRVFAFLRRLCANPELANDLTQETFLKLHKARGAFGAGRQALPWTYAIARNCYLSHLRAGRNRPMYAPRESTENDTRLDTSAEDMSIAKQSAAIVERELMKMSEARREAFILVRYEGLSVADAAQVLGISESALKVRAFHAYELIRAALSSHEASSQQTNVTPLRPR